MLSRKSKFSPVHQVSLLLNILLLATRAMHFGNLSSLLCPWHMVKLNLQKIYKTLTINLNLLLGINYHD